MNSCGNRRSPFWSASIQSSSTAASMRRMASSSGMHVSVTRLRWRASRSASSFAESSR